jgi:ABC-type bacteriocin/lantibiotic exporter with double-glycine peptidase domain
MYVLKGAQSGYVYLYGGMVVFQPSTPVPNEDPYVSVLLNVPYGSQWATTAQRSVGDCGIACLSMVAASRGIDFTVDEILTLAELPGGRSTYSMWELKKAAQAIGVTLTIKVPAYWADIKSEIKAGKPVIVLHRYGELEGNQDTFTGAHFSVVVGFDGTDVIVNDPNFWGDHMEEGRARRIPLDDFERAIGSALLRTGNNANQSLFLGE